MFFDAKTIVAYGLIALAHASALPELSKRAKIGDFSCPDGTILSKDDVSEATRQCQSFNDASLGKYPAYFGNKNGNQKVFTNIPDGTDLREFPLLVGSVYGGVGEPGPYRVVTDYKDYGYFRGVMQHTGATVGGGYTACTLVA